MQIEENRLKNGLKYFYIQNKKSEKANIILCLNKGSLSDEKEGTAHLLEHINLIFDKFQMYSHIFECTACGYTDYGCTVYQIQTSNCQNNIKRCVEIIKNILTGAYINNDYIEVARKDVEEEFYRNSGNNIKLLSVISGTEYEIKQPLGNIDVIKIISLQDIYEFYYKYYKLQNALLIIRGCTLPELKEIFNWNTDFCGKYSLKKHSHHNQVYSKIIHYRERTEIYLVRKSESYRNIKYGDIKEFIQRQIELEMLILLVDRWILKKDIKREVKILKLSEKDEFFNINIYTKRNGISMDNLYKIVLKEINSDLLYKKAVLRVKIDLVNNKYANDIVNEKLYRYIYKIILSPNSEEIKICLKILFNRKIKESVKKNLLQSFDLLRFIN